MDVVDVDFGWGGRKLILCDLLDLGYLGFVYEVCVDF